MSKMPCPSDFRSGDESNPSSPYYKEPEEQKGKEMVEFDWFIYFSPHHPILGEEAECILKGEVFYTDTQEAISSKRKQSSVRAVSEGLDEDLPYDRTFDDFVVHSIEFADGRILTVEQLEIEPGFGTKAEQFDELKEELLDSSEQALNEPIKNKKAIIDLRTKWKSSSASSRSTPKM